MTGDFSFKVFDTGINGSGLVEVATKEYGYCIGESRTLVKFSVGGSVNQNSDTVTLRFFDVRPERSYVELECDGKKVRSVLEVYELFNKLQGGINQQQLKLEKGAILEGRLSDLPPDVESAYKIEITSSGTPEKLTPSSSSPISAPAGGGCLIATAAFGSGLTPQVQFLRNFRDNHIMSTIAGSSFMNVFNAWYYSFSPYVADYERQQPWLQQTVKASIYPLLGILQISEKGYSSVEGEYGALVAGAIASSMIGALYFSPVALSVKQIRKSRFNYKLAASLIAIVSVAVLSSIFTGNEYALMTTTSLFVLTMLSVSAILFARIIIRIKNRFF